jgi:hypothetical protein
MIPANCVCKLVSRGTRPLMWEVDVIAMEWPHKGKRGRFVVPAHDEQAAATAGMEQFAREIFLRGVN